MKKESRIFNPYKLIATFFNIGHISKSMPGTIGSFLALPIWLYITNILMINFASDKFIYSFWAIFLILLFFLGVHSADMIEKATKSKDPSSIIIDEVLGQLITLVLTHHLIIHYFNEDYMINIAIYGVYFFVNLSLFRFFDIAKPSFIGVADKKLTGGLGVMVDDVLAGIAAAAVINVVAIMV